jgi:hypothetical protein
VITDATARQKVIIARLCMALGIKEEVEQRLMPKGEAGRLIRELLARIKDKE